MGQPARLCCRLADNFLDNRYVVARLGRGFLNGMFLMIAVERVQVVALPTVIPKEGSAVLLRELVLARSS